MFGRRPMMLATLCIGRHEAKLLCSYDGITTSNAIISGGPEEMSRTEFLHKSLETFLAGLPPNRRTNRIAIAKHCRWRLVIPGGYYTTAARPQGVWTTTLADAAAIELEHQCPISLDELMTSAIPINANKAWVCGMEQRTLDSWALAARDVGIEFEGMWTHASALVEWILENSFVSADGPLIWQDGFTGIELHGFGSHAPLGAISNDDTRSLTNSIRIQSSREPAMCSETMRRALCKGSSIPIEGCNVSDMPGLAAHYLKRVNPSESLNLARSQYRSLSSQRLDEAPIARGLLAASCAAIVFICASLVNTSNAQKDMQNAQSQVGSLWRQTQGTANVPAMPVSELERQVAIWRAANKSVAIDSGPHSILTLWAALVSHLPADLPVSVASIRTNADELWVEGQVRSQADARRLESAWSALPELKADPIRLDSNGGATVNFSLKMEIQ